MDECVIAEDRAQLPGAQVITESAMAAEMDASQTATLLEEADPVIRAAIRRKLRVTLRANDSRELNLDGLDLLGEVQLKLLGRLHRDGEREPAGIAEFKAYAATVAYHCCSDYLRAKYPQRTSLKNSLRRLLEKKDGYASWNDSQGELLCGYAGWRTGVPPAGADRVRELQRPDALPESALPRGAAESLTGREWLLLLEAVFDAAGGPVAMDDLLAIVGPLTGVEDVGFYEDAHGGEEDEPTALDRVAARTADPYSERLTVERLKLYWEAVLQLLPWHRAAYLLNLRDGDLDALPYYGVTSLTSIGDALELKEKQIAVLEQEVGLGPGSGSRRRPGERFALCWPYLPVEDTVIGLVLEVTRAQVIGYRNKAKERLARLLKGVLG